MSDISIDSDDFSDMYNSAKHGNHVRLQQLLDRPSNRALIDKLNARQFDISLLMIAAMHENTSVTEVLLDQGADINIVNPEHGLTPLMMVAGHNLPMVTLLLERGADPNMLDPEGYTALKFAAEGNRPDIMIELIRRGARVDLPGQVNLLGQVALMGRMKVIMILLHHGVDINERLDEHDDTALIRSVFGKCYYTVDLLLRLGADVNARDDEGRTALQYAISNHHPEMRDLLIQHGAIIREGSTTNHYTTECLNDICNICLNPFEDDAETTVLSCIHNFHPECIEEWLGQNDTCPTCRQ